MASRFWVGGTGTWDASDTTHWSATSGGTSGASVPGVGDDVFVNGSAGGGTVTVNTDFVINNFDINSFTGTIDFSVNNNSPTFATFGGSTTGTLKMGSGTLIVTGTGSFAWSNNGTTIVAGSSTIKFTDTGVSEVRFLGSGRTWNKIWFARGSSTGINSVYQSNTISELRDTGTAAHSFIFQAGSTNTITTPVISGTAGNIVTLNSTTTGTFAIVKSGGGTVSCDYMNIQHSVATPANTWYAGTNSTNNQAVATAGSGWIFTAPPVPMYDGSFFQLF